MKKILIIEDHEEMRDLISFNLSNNSYETIGFENANEALAFLEDSDIDLILLDLMLPGLKGMQFLKIIRELKKYNHIPVIIISAKNTEQDIVSALETGADDYLTKPFSMKILTAKINILLKRKTNQEEDVVKLAGIEIDKTSHKVFIEESEINLSNKEFELLLLMFKNPKKVFTRNYLLDTIWGYSSEVYSRTVDTHISSLRKKLGDKGKIIKSVPKIGYRLEV
jgi:two-component system phosphate regulon response regulator PhoB